MFAPPLPRLFVLPPLSSPSPLSLSLLFKYTFSGTDEEETDDMNLPDEVQGYICVSTDFRRNGTAKGGETFIITKTN